MRSDGRVPPSLRFARVGDGGLSFLPTYWTSPPTNQFMSLTGVSVKYDANGNLLTDNLNTYTWDPNWGNMSTVSTGSTTVTATYDALGRAVEQQNGRVPHP
jgi:YD repeat-containing protein